MYKFLVAYAHAGGFGRCFVTWGEIFEDDVVAIEEAIRANNGTPWVSILTIQPLPIVPSK